MSRISIILNTDSRPTNREFTGMWNGVRSRDFFGRPNLENKLKFFEGFDVELIVFLDRHEDLSHEEYDTLHSLADCLVVRKHSRDYRGANPFSAFNDVNYLQAFSQARSNIVAHFDHDVAAFRADKSDVDKLLEVVESDKSKFVCYPSPQSPHPCEAPNYQNQWWASTRFFICKRDTLILDDLERGIRDNEWLYAKYGRPHVVNPWTEAMICQMAGYSVLYPPVDLDRWAVFPWKQYDDGVLQRLNDMPHHQVADALRRAGGWGIFWDGAESRLMNL